MSTRPIGAALALAAVVAGGGWAVTLANRHTAVRVAPQATPSPTPLDAQAQATTTPTPLPVPPPPGIDLLWRAAGQDVDRLEALDWTGQVRGGLALPASTNNLGGVTPSRDGQRLLVEKDFDFTVLSAQGAPLAQFSGEGGNLRPMWSEDDTHLCAVRHTGDTSADVVLISLGGSTRTLTSLHWPLGDGGPQIDVCSVASDVVVITVSLGDDAAGHVEELKVVRMSSGAVLRDTHPPAPAYNNNDSHPAPGALWWVTGSGDGRLMALTPYSEMNATSAHTAIVDTVTGRTLGHVDAFVRGFTNDGASVFTDDGIVNWRTGHITHPVPDCCGSTAAIRPSGGDVVISVPGGPPPTPNPGGPTGPYPPPIFLLLHPDGSTVRLACCDATIL